MFSIFFDSLSILSFLIFIIKNGALSTSQKSKSGFLLGNGYYIPWRSQSFDAEYEVPSEPPVCNSALPCYDITLNIVGDGECDTGDLRPNPERFLKHYAKVGLTKADIIADGRKAAAFFKTRTGLDFTSLPDEAFIRGSARIRNGSVLFTPSAQPFECNLRLTTVQNQDQVQLINRPGDEVFWALIFTQETKISGELGSVVPAGSALFAGSWVIEPCGESKTCKSILFPNQPRTPIFMRYTTSSLSTTILPGRFGNLDEDFFHPVWGRGLATGLWFGTRRAERKRVDISIMIRFPWPL